jgi:hypothetical protein
MNSAAEQFDGRFGYESDTHKVTSNCDETTLFLMIRPMISFSKFSGRLLRIQRQKSA